MIPKNLWGGYGWISYYLHGCMGHMIYICHNFFSYSPSIQGYASHIHTKPNEREGYLVAFGAGSCQWVFHWYNLIDIARRRWDDRLHTFTFTYLSLWWRINFLCLFLTMFGCFKGLTFWRAIVIPSDSTNHKRLHNNMLYSQQIGLWG